MLDIKKRLENGNIFERRDGDKITEPGDVFVFDDSITKKKDPVPNGTRILRYRRPVIVISTGYKLSTVIPLTTKTKNMDVTYPVMVLLGTQSNAMFTQANTVDNFRLGKKIGSLKKAVWQDLLNTYVKYLQNPTDKIERTAPFTSGLDINHFENLYYYAKRPDYKDGFLCIHHNNGIYALPTSLWDDYDGIAGRFSSTSNTIRGTMGYIIDPTKLTYITDYFHDDEWECVGVELNPAAARILSETLYWLYGFDNYNDKIDNSIACSFSQIIVENNWWKDERFKISNFMDFKNDAFTIDGIDALFSKDALQRYSKYGLYELDQTLTALNSIRGVILPYYNIFRCPIEKLRWMKDNVPAFKTHILSFADSVVRGHDGDKEIRTLNLGGDEANPENCEWIAEEIDKELDEFNAASRGKE